MTMKKTCKTKSNNKTRTTMKKQHIPIMNFIVGTPLDTEISMGKGHGVGLRAGNQQYHAYVVANVPRYNALTKMQRSGLFKDMVKMLKKKQGRFFDTDEASGRYYEVRDSVAQAKVGQVRFLLSDRKRRFVKVTMIPFCPTFSNSACHPPFICFLHDVIVNRQFVTPLEWLKKRRKRRTSKQSKRWGRWRVLPIIMHHQSRGQ
jgi:hypothetical protein